MKQFQFSPFSTESITQIIEEAIQILEQPGVRIENKDALILLGDAGCPVDFTSSTASIPEIVVYKCLESIPSEFFLYNMENVPVVKYGGDDVHFDPGSTAITILDHKTQKQRLPITDDLVKFVKLVELIPQMDAQSTAMVCSDVAEEIGDLYRLYLSLNFMKKPIITGAFRKDTWWAMKEMLSIVRGGDEALSERPLAVFDVCPSPPLLWSDLTCQNLIDCAKASIPAELVSMPLAGATAPVTLAAAIVQHTAECLSGVVIHQLTNPGSPIVWGGSPAAFDMRYGTTPMGSAGTWLIDAGYVQVGKHLNIPTHVYMGMSDSKVVDAQCGFESMGGCLMAALTGANMVSGAGMLDYERCQSFEKLVIDAEIIRLCRRVIDGIKIREQPIGVDLIQEMGHQAGYLSHPHTRRWFKEEIEIPSSIVDRGSFEAWESEGSKSALDRAHSQVELISSKYQPTSVISDHVRDELYSITLREAKRFGMEELPLVIKT